MPSADDLFRPTAPTTPTEAPQGDGSAPPASSEPTRTLPSGRVRHDEKMTVYITSEELLAVEQARLTLRSAHALAVDRGRLVREALALTLADFEARGEDSALVRRLVEE